MTLLEYHGEYASADCDICGEHGADLYEFRTGPSRYRRVLCPLHAEQSGRRP